MKIVFALRSWANVHYYHSLISALMARGHAVHLLFDAHWSANDPRDALDTLLAEHPEVSWEHLRLRGVSRPWANAARELRSYRRYLVVKGQSDYYRRRWRRYLPLFLKALVCVPGVNAVLASALVGKFFKWFEQGLSPVQEVVTNLRELQPDVVIAAPANLRFDTELEYLKAAKALGIPTAIPVYSWDNLTTKGLLHIVPDRLLAWNEVQKREAREHEISGERARIVGSLFFDKWLMPRSPTPYAEFCRKWNLDPAKPFVLYLGSSRNIAPDETWLIGKLYSALGLQVLARPHPANTRPYEERMLKEIKYMPPGKGIPATPKAVQDLYDALIHAAAVVGINTSAMLDAICLDRPVISVLANEYKETQEEAAHFNALRESGAIYTVNDVTECKRKIEEILSGKDIASAKRKEFLSK